LQETIRSHPGEITLLTIGPLTNVALLFKTDPEIPAMLKSLVMMCGVYTNRLAGVGPVEWNARVDPHATWIVYRQAVSVHRSIGLDVTCQVRMAVNEVRQRFQADLLRPVLDFAEVWFKDREEITFHDPLAAATIFDDQICHFERGLVEVELLSQEVHGLTYWTSQTDDPKIACPHEVALQVDVGRFYRHYFSVFR
jgi:inosine-uridine nucleoside N-ribohydrolase